MTYKKKSYHSIVVPSKLAAATFLIEAVCSRPSPPFLSTHASFYSFLCISSGPDRARLEMRASWLLPSHLLASSTLVPGRLISASRDNSLPGCQVLAHLAFVGLGDQVDRHKGDGGHNHDVR